MKINKKEAGIGSFLKKDVTQSFEYYFPFIHPLSHSLLQNAFAANSIYFDAVNNILSRSSSSALLSVAFFASLTSS